MERDKKSPSFSVVKGRKAIFSDPSYRDDAIVTSKDILDYVPLIRTEGDFNSQGKLLKARIRINSGVLLSTEGVLMISPHSKDYIKNALASDPKGWEVTTLSNLCIYIWYSIPLVVMTYSGKGLIEDLVLGDY